MFWIFSAFFFLILISLILEILISIFKNHKNATGGIINYDSTMKKFVYKVTLSSEEIIALLKAKKDIDELSCDFDFEEATIKISEYSSYRTYRFQIQECNGFSVLRLEQIEFIGMQSYVPYKLNPFMISKLSAEIVPFSQFGFLIHINMGLRYLFCSG